jgi:ribosomal protein S18 acetylase RimI-like enzyme
MEAIGIRRAVLDDLEDVLRLNRELFAKEEREFDMSVDSGWAYGTGKEYFVSRLSDDGGAVFVASADGVTVGYLCGGLKARGFRKEGIYAELENMFVGESYRGRGAGGRLIETFLAWCDGAGVNQVFVTASAANVRAVDFYRRHGFGVLETTLETTRKPFGDEVK